MARASSWLAVAVTAFFASTASADLFQASFEMAEGYTPGTVAGQGDWVEFGNNFTTGDVVAAPAGTPAALGAQSLLLKQKTDTGLAGVLTGSLSDGNGNAYGPVGSSVMDTSAPVGNPTVVGNSNVSEFWFRTAATTAAGSGFADGDFFMTANWASGSDRFGRAGLWQRTGTTYQITTDSYGEEAFNGAPDGQTYDGAASSYPDNTVATGLNWGQWYRMVLDFELNDITVTPSNSGHIYTSEDVVEISIFDEFGAQIGTTLANAGTWRLPWSYGPPGSPAGFGYNTDAEILANGPVNEYAFTRINFRLGGAGTAGMSLMYVDDFAPFIPEPTACSLLLVGGAALLTRRCRAS